MEMRNTNWRRLAWASVPVLFSFVWCFIYGRLGLNPLDSGIVFDGAFRLNQGQEFFKDFASPAGFTPIFLQSFFFELFGTNWFAYLLHASLFNALFSLVTYSLLRKFDLPHPIAAFYALLSGIVFYPPFGAPYPDQHAFFFSLLTLFLLVASTKSSGRKGTLLLALVAPALLLAALSKQIPSGYAFLLLFPLVLLLHAPRHWPKTFLKLAAGLPICFLLLWWMFDLEALFSESARFQFWEMPRALGSERLAELGYPPMKTFRAVLFRQFQVLCSHTNGHLIAVYYLPVAALLALAGRWWYRKQRGDGRMEDRMPSKLAANWVLAWGLLAVGGGFVLLTQNQQENGLALVFVALGLAHAGYLALLRWLGEGFVRLGDYELVFSILISALFMGHAAWDGFHFQRHVIETRMVHDFPPGEAPAFNWPWEDRNSMTAGLSSLHWDEPYFHTDRNPAPLLSFLRAEGQPFFLWGDMNFIYPLCDQLSPVPSLWLHTGLTIPPPDSPWRAAWDRQFLENLRELSPRYLIYETPDGNSYMDERLSLHPAIHQWIESRKGRAFRIGGFYLWELASPSK